MNMMRSAIIIAIVIIAVGVFVVLLVAPEEITGQDRPIFSFFTGDAEEETSEEEEEDAPRPMGGAGGGGGEGGGGGGGGSSSGGTPSCTVDSASYALLGKSVYSFCVSESGGVCTQQSVECSITIRNLDETQSGTFAFLAKIYEEGQSSANPLMTETLSAPLSPGQSATLQHMFTISGAEAALEWDCVFETVSVPQIVTC